VDIVFANAGVTEVGKFLEEDGDGEPKKPQLKTLDVNLTGTLYCEFIACKFRVIVIRADEK
jgi:hypothetical protein